MINFLVLGYGSFNDDGILVYREDIDEFAILFLEKNKDFIRFEVFSKILTHARKIKRQIYKADEIPMKIGNLNWNKVPEMLQSYCKSINMFLKSYNEDIVSLIDIYRINSIYIDGVGSYIDIQSMGMDFRFGLNDMKIIRYLSKDGDSQCDQRTSHLMGYMNSNKVKNFAFIKKSNKNECKILCFQSL